MSEPCCMADAHGQACTCRERLYTQAELDAAVRAERDRWRGLLGRYACHVAEYEGTYYLDREPPVDADEAILRKSLGGGWLPYEDHADVQAAIDDAIRERGE